MFSAVHNLFRYAGLFVKEFARIGVVCVDYNGRVVKPAFSVYVGGLYERLIVIVRLPFAVLVNGAAQYGMGQVVPVCLDFPAGVNKHVRGLRGKYWIEHYPKIARCRVFHAYRYIEAARRKAVLLVFDGARAYGDIWKYVRKVRVIFWVKHFVGGREPRFVEYSYVHTPYGLKAADHVGVFFEVGLVKHSLVAESVSSRLVCINARNDEYFVFDLFLKAREALYVFADGVFMVRGAGAYYEQEPVVHACKYISYFCVTRRFCPCKVLIKWIFLAQLFGVWKFSYILKAHIFSSRYLFMK